VPQYLKNAPDDHDVYNVLCAIGEDYGQVVEITVEYKADYIQSIARSYAVGGVVDKVVVYQAMHRRKYRPAKPQAEVNFTLAYDILMQASGGGATAAGRGPAHEYSGRVIIPRGRT